MFNWIKALSGANSARHRRAAKAKNPRHRSLRFEHLEDRRLLSVNGTQYRYDIGSSGLNSNETVLTPANVTAGSFGKQFSITVDGQVLAEPLYMAGLTITGQGVHDVVFVATEHDSLYAFDANSGQQLWKIAFATNYTGVTVTSVPSSDINSGDISPEIGITDTPAIDASTGFLYVVTKTKEVHGTDTSNPHYVNTLYKVNIHDGTFTGTVIADTTHNSNGSYTYNSGPYVIGTGDGAITVSGQSRVYFNSMRQMFRPGVSLVNGQVVLGSASHGDNGPYHGWMLTYNESDLALTGVLNATPNGGLGGIWQGGDPIISDGQGNFFFETGNGSFNQNASNFNAAGMPIDGDYGDSFVKVTVDTVHNSPTNQNVNGWGLQVVDYFTPYNQNSLNSGDTDLGSGGPTILPDSAGSAAHPHLLVGGGKQGSVYLIDRDNMGKFNSTTDNIVQELANTVGGILSTPSYFNGKIYITSGYNGPIDSFTISNAHLTASTTTGDSYGNLDGSPVISSNGTANGIVWGLDRGTGQLRAYSTDALGTLLYSSAQTTGDQLGSVMKFTSVMVADGKVFAGTGNSIVMYSLNLPPTTPPNAPTNLVVNQTSGSLVTLGWTDNSTNESSFKIERSIDGVNFSLVGTASVSSMSFSDTTVQPFTTYYYRVYATNIIGDSDYTNVVIASTEGNPAVGGGDGLYAQYYAGNGVDLTTATPVYSRVDSTVNFDWGTVGPGTPLGTTAFEVRWTGEIQAQFSEAYTFSTYSDDGVRLYINGQLVIDDFTDHSPTTDTSAAITLEAGKVYSIEMDYYQNGGGANAQLKWSSAHTVSAIVPQSQLFSGSAPAAPTNLQATAASGTQISLTWTNHSTDEDGYEIDRMDSNNAWAPLVFLPAGTSSYFDTQLASGTDYTYRVRATNFRANSDYSNTVTIAPAIPPAPPSDAHVTAITPTSISMAWTNNATNATAIRIFRSAGAAGGNFIFVASLPPNTTSYTDLGPNGAGLTPGVSYDYHIQAGNIAGYTDFTGIHVQTLTVAPTQLDAVPADGQITLSWTIPNGASTFNIYRSTTPNGEGAVPYQTGISGNTFLDVVSDFTTYYYRVTAVDTGGESARSSETSATARTATDLPAAPSLITATAGDHKVSIAWHAVSSATSYNLYRSDASGAEVLVASNLTGVSYVDTGLTNDQPYYYQITAVNALGEGVRSTEFVSTPTLTAPPTPIAVEATPGDGTVSLSWSPADDALTYNIYRTDDDSGEEVLYQQGIVDTTFVDNNVTNGQTYYYQVSAGNGVGESNLSQEVVATPLPPLPATPSGFTASAINLAQIHLGWTETSTNVDSFLIQRSTDGGATFSDLTTVAGNVNAYSDSNGLLVGTTYTYRVVAQNLAGDSSPTVTSSATPLAQLPPPWSDADIGSPPLAGSAYYSNGSITVNGSGADIYGTSDQFNFVYQSSSGSNTIIAEVNSQTNTDPWAKSGVMFRNTLAANSAWVMMVITPGNGASFQYRDTSGNTNNVALAGYTAPSWVKLVRAGTTYTGYVSTDGVNWTQVGTVTMTLNTNIFVGLADTSHNTAAVSTANFSQISIKGSSVPAAPTGLTASAQNGSSVLLSWTNNGTNNTFANHIYRLNNTTGVYDLIGTVGYNTTTFTDTDLDSGVQYTYHVAATNTIGDSAAASISISTPTIPPAVSFLQTSGVTVNSISLNWQLNSSNNTGVSIMRRVNGTGPFTLVTTLGATATFYMDTALQSGTLYEYQVAAINLAGTSAVNDAGATTLPGQPTGLAAQAVGGSLQLTWNAPVGAVAYNLYRGLSPGGEGSAPYATINNVSQYTDNGVTPGQVYYYRVSAIDFSGESLLSSEISGAVPVAPPDTPTNLSVTGGDQSATINWNPVSGATSYKIYRSLTPGGEGTTAYRTGILAPTFTDTGLTNGVTYYYQVVASNGGGSSAKSSELVGQPSGTIASRLVFYNNSAFDGNNVAANSSDDGAIATDKSALLPGQQASFANYISYSKGINGIMVDITHLPGTVTANDFIFTIGNVDDSSTWAAAAAPISVTVRPGAGVGGADRVTIIWADNAIPNKNWLHVTVKADANTGLTNADDFYYGLEIGETGNSPTDTNVSTADEILARNNPADPIHGLASITDVYDFNRDMSVTAVDQILARNNPADAIINGRLKLITAPTSAHAMAMGGFFGGLADNEYELPTLSTEVTALSALSTAPPALSTALPELGTALPALGTALPALGTALPALGTALPALGTAVSPALPASFATSADPIGQSVSNAAIFAGLSRLSIAPVSAAASDNFRAAALAYQLSSAMSDSRPNPFASLAAANPAAQELVASAMRSTEWGYDAGASELRVDPAGSRSEDRSDRLPATDLDGLSLDASSSDASVAPAVDPASLNPPESDGDTATAGTASNGFSSAATAETSAAADIGSADGGANGDAGPSGKSA